MAISHLRVTDMLMIGFDVAGLEDCAIKNKTMYISLCLGWENDLWHASMRETLRGAELIASWKFGQQRMRSEPPIRS